MDKSKRFKVKVGAFLKRHAEEREGVANAADPTAWSSYTWTIGGDDIGLRPKITVEFVAAFSAVTANVHVWTGRRRIKVAFVSDVVNRALYPLVEWAWDAIEAADLAEYCAGNAAAARFEAYGERLAAWGDGRPNGVL